MAKLTNASLLARIAELEAQLADCRGDTVEHIRTDNGLTRHQIDIGAKKHNHTPSAVDAIRLYTWAAMTKGVDRGTIVKALIDQKYTPATVRARVARIFGGVDESCYSEEIRARLGIDDLVEADAVEDEALAEMAEADEAARDEEFGADSEEDEGDE